MDTTTKPRDAVPGRSLTGLFSDLWRDTSRLVHEEAELAKAELYEKVSQVGNGLASVGAGGAILFAGFVVLLFAAVGALGMLLATEHAIWLAPLIVGGVVMVIGFAILSRGRRELKAGNLKPERTMRSVGRDARLAKEHLQ